MYVLIVGTKDKINSIRNKIRPIQVKLTSNRSCGDIWSHYILVILSTEAARDLAYQPLTRAEPINRNLFIPNIRDL